jgi:hypothetical protein
LNEYVTVFANRSTKVKAKVKKKKLKIKFRFGDKRIFGLHEGDMEGVKLFNHFLIKKPLMLICCGRFFAQP